MAENEKCIGNSVVNPGDVSDSKSTSGSAAGDDKPKHHGIENLIPFNDLTQEEQRQIARAGGKASGEARRKKKELRERCKILLEMMPNKDLIKKSLGNDVELPDGSDNYDLLVAKMIQTAVLEGNVKAAEFVRDSAGDKPTDKSEVSASVMTAKDLEILQNVSSRLSATDGQKTEE